MGRRRPACARAWACGTAGAGSQMLAVIALLAPVQRRKRPTRRTLAVARSPRWRSRSASHRRLHRVAPRGLRSERPDDQRRVEPLRPGRPWADCTKFTPPSGHRGFVRNDAAVAARLPQRRNLRLRLQQPHRPRGSCSAPPTTSPNIPTRWRCCRGGRRPRSSASRWNTCTPCRPRHDPPGRPEPRSYSDLSANELIAFLLYGPDITAARTSSSNTGRHAALSARPTAASRRRRAAEEMGAASRAWTGRGWCSCWRCARAARGCCRAAPARAHGACSLSALVLLFFPILTKGYDYRFVIPAYGPLVAAGALAAWGVAVRVRTRLRARRAAQPGFADR